MIAAHRHTPARWVRWTLAAVGALIGCVLFGITTAGADLSLGPHEARYDVTLGGEVVADLGPLGTLRIDSPVAPVGVDVTVREIPADLTEIDGAATLEDLSEDLQAYLQFFTSPDTTIAAVTDALVRDALRQTGLAVLTVVLVGAGVWFLLGARRRHEISEITAPRTWQLTAGVVAVALFGGVLMSDAVAPQRDDPTSPVFEGTALEGARLTGRLAGIIDTYGAQLLDIYRDNEQFYADSLTSLQDAWDERAASDERLEAWADAQTSLGGGTAGSGVVAPQVDEDERYVTFMVMSDLHCNMSMTPLLREVAVRSGTDVVLDAGDTTMNGTAVERVCVDSFASVAPDGVPIVVADGNHDSSIIVDSQRSHGMTVLEGDVVEVKGVKILGDRDPKETRVGSGSSLRGDETFEDASKRLADVACEADGVDLLLIHTPPVGNDTLTNGCAQLQVSGHTHRRADPFQFGNGIRYVNASTAGAVSGGLTVGPLNGTAEITLLRYDTVEKRFTQWRLVEVNPDTTAAVSEWQGLPEVVPAEEPDEDALKESQEQGVEADEKGADADENGADEDLSSPTPSAPTPAP